MGAGLAVLALLGIGLIVWVLVPSTVVLPNVVGMAQAEAEEALRAEGLEVRVDTREGFNKEAGTVLEQNPSDGEAEEGSTVAVVVGKAREPASGYDLVENDPGNLSVEVPSGWSDHRTGDDGMLTGERADAGEGFGPSITASPDVDAFENISGSGVPGTYIVASRELARGYTEDQLVGLGFNDLSSSSCEPGTPQDFERSYYSGRMQWWDCGGSSRLTLAAAPAGRKCVVMLQILAYGDYDREAAQRILDTFEADCARIP